MIRTLISLDPEEKAWLDQKARETGRTMTAVVREAVARYRAEDSRRKRPVGTLLTRTSGIWKRGDGLAWQRRLRSEWGKR